MNFWNNFAAKHPAAAKWVREGGLFVIVSNLITVFKYLLLQFLPAAFKSLPVVDFGWPGIDITLFGETFKWNILGYDAAHGGLPYFCAYMIAMIIGECINFPIQRSFVFRSKGNLGKQIAWYVLAFCVITCIVNSINCIWVAVAGLLVPDFIYNIGTTVLNDGHERRGQRYVQLAADGDARPRVPDRHRLARLDGHRPCGGHMAELADRGPAAAAVLGQSGRHHGAAVLVAAIP